MKKIIIALVCVVLLIAAVFVLFPFLIGSILNQNEFSEMKIVNKYYDYSTEIILISEFLENYSCKSILVDLSGQGFRLTLCDKLPVEKETIEDELLLEAVTTIFDSGCKIIEKSENCVYFQFASTLYDGGGILYVGYGASPPKYDSSEFKLITEHIENNIYYYRTDLKHSNDKK